MIRRFFAAVGAIAFVNFAAAVAGSATCSADDVGAPNAPQTPQFLALAIVFATIDFTVMFCYAALGSQAVRALKKSGALWLDRLCGGALLALAGSLAFYRRAGA